MALRFDLGPSEKLFIGKTVLTNSHARTRFVLEGITPVLRERDFIPPAVANGSLERLYCCIQQMYLEEAFAKYKDSYFELLAQAVEDNPSAYSDLKVVEGLAQNGDLYRALKALKKLVGLSTDQSA
jgi:flagellar protein FlbT